MSFAIQFLISFIRDRIPEFDERAELFRRKVPKNGKNAFTEEILNICKDHAKIQNSLIELEEGRHTKKDHSHNATACHRRITCKKDHLLKLIS